MEVQQPASRASAPRAAGPLLLGAGVCGNAQRPAVSGDRAASPAHSAPPQPQAAAACPCSQAWDCDDEHSQHNPEALCCAGLSASVPGQREGHQEDKVSGAFLEGPEARL